MGFYADFHIHSRYSRGTSKALDLAQLAAWAGIKGITVLGCGISLAPAATRKLKGICPACRKPLTLGVLYRVQELADQAREPRVPFVYQIPPETNPGPDPEMWRGFQKG